MFDIKQALQSLAEERPIFHSEADFQHSLAWTLRSLNPDLRIRLERPISCKLGRINLDILIEGVPRVAIELKYMRKAIDLVIQGEHYSQKEDARDLSRYDFWKDVIRLENLVAEGLIDRGYAIAISNDPGHWDEARGRHGNNDAEFQIYEGLLKSGALKWAASTGAGTLKGREAPHILSGAYKLTWSDYSKIRDRSYGDLRYLLIEVRKPQDSAPSESD